MKIEITQEINKEYYMEYFSEWLNYRSKYRKWQHVIGFSILLISGITYLFDNFLYYISFGFFVFGCLMVFDFYYSKWAWVNQRLKSKMNNVEVKFIFEESHFKSIGPFTKLDGNWSYFHDALETKRGVIFIPENGISFYLQRKNFPNSDDLQSIIKKVKQNKY